MVADAKIHSGAGHLMRCLRYSQEFSKRNIKTFLIGSIEIPWILESDIIDNFFSISQKKDLNFKPGDLIIVDSYDFENISWLSDVASKFPVIQIVDDVTDFINDAYIVNLNPVNSNLSDFKVDNDRYFWGIKYFPCTKILKKSNPTDTLFIGGGGDANDFSLEILKNFKKIDDIEMHFHLFSRFTESQKQVPKLTLHKLGFDLNKVLPQCVNVVSAAGTSVWDFLANGFNLAVVKSVSNQNNNYNFLVDNSLAIGLGEYNHDSWTLDYEALRKFLFNTKSESRNNMENLGLDFLGGKRFVSLALDIFQNFY